MLQFQYDEDRDIDCLLSIGGGSQNQPGNKTKAYEALLKHVQDLNDRELVRIFVRDYMLWNNIDIQNNLQTITRNWESVSGEFEKRAEKIFGAHIEDTIKAYLTITGRFPYSLQDKFFYVSANTTDANRTAMHELWHFYTWEKFGWEEEQRMGREKYNDLKEALTVLLNVECKDLMGDRLDEGYPQHQELRQRVVELWEKTKDINAVWAGLS